MSRRVGVWLACVLWALSCLPVHAIVLRYTPKVGSVAKHKTTMTGTTTTIVPGMEAGGMKMTISEAIQTTDKVLSAGPKTVTVETRVTSGKMTMKMGGQSQSLDIPQSRAVVEMDNRGRTVKTLEDDTDFGAEGMMGSPLDFNDFSEFAAAFPDGDLKVKDTWSGQMKFPLEEGQDFIITATSRLLELGTFEGRKCAKIRSTFKGPFSLEVPEQEGQGKVTGSLHAQFVSYYDYVNSVYVSAEGTITMTMKITATDPEEGTFTATSKSTMNMKVKLVK